jgi:hypothetical protein
VGQIDMTNPYGLATIQLPGQTTATSTAVAVAVPAVTNRIPDSRAIANLPDVPLRTDVVVNPGPLVPNGIDFQDSEQYPTITGNVIWDFWFQGRHLTFGSLNDALMFLDQNQQNAPLNEVLGLFENIRARYLLLKAQKEFGGGLLEAYAKESNILRHYQSNEAMHESTKAFWAEAKKDRDKVQRHIRGVRSLVSGHQWMTQAFVNYIMGAMGVSVLERRVYETHLPRARANGLTARNVMRRAEQRRFARLRADPTTMALHVTVRDIGDAVEDLISDPTIIDRPAERITGAQLGVVTKELQTKAPDLYSIKGDSDLWGYVNEPRQFYVPPNIHRDLHGMITKHDQDLSLQEQWEPAHLATARPAISLTRAQKAAVRRGEPVPPDGPKVRKPPKRSRKAKGKKKHPALTENEAAAEDEEEDEENEDQATSGQYSGEAGGHGNTSKRMRLEGEDMRVNDLSETLAKLSLRTCQTRKNLEQRKKKLVPASELEFPGRNHHPFKIALFNKAKNDAMRFKGVNAGTAMNAQDTQTWSNIGSNTAAIYKQAEELFEDMEQSEYSNDTIMMIIGQIWMTLRAYYEVELQNTFVTSAMRFLQGMWQMTYASDRHIALLRGGPARAGQAALTTTDFASFDVQQAGHGLLTEQAILSALLTGTQGTHIPNINALALWANDNTNDPEILPPLDDGAQEEGRIALVLHRGAHWLLVTINTETREFNVLDSAAWADFDGSMDRWAQRTAERYIRAQFPDWFQGTGPTSRRGTVRSLQQSNDVDCGIYVIENAMAIDEGEPRAQQVFTQLARLYLTRRFAHMAQVANPDTPIRSPFHRPRPSESTWDTFKQVLELRHADAVYDRLPDEEIYESIEDAGPGAKIMIALANDTRDALERQRRAETEAQARLRSGSIAGSRQGSSRSRGSQSRGSQERQFSQGRPRRASSELSDISSTAFASRQGSHRLDQSPRHSSRGSQQLDQGSRHSSRGSQQLNQSSRQLSQGPAQPTWHEIAESLARQRGRQQSQPRRSTVSPFDERGSAGPRPISPTTVALKKSLEDAARADALRKSVQGTFASMQKNKKKSPTPDSEGGDGEK